jgi:hypothetical protein
MLKFRLNFPISLCLLIRKNGKEHGEESEEEGIQESQEGRTKAWKERVYLLFLGGPNRAHQGSARSKHHGCIQGDRSALETAHRWGKDTVSRACN